MAVAQGFQKRWHLRERHLLISIRDWIATRLTQLKHLNDYFHVLLQSWFKLSDGRYPSASKFAMAGFILTLLNIIFTLLVGVLALSLMVRAYYPTECSTLYSRCYDPDGKTHNIAWKAVLCII